MTLRRRAGSIGRGLGLGLLVGLACGAAAALFLALLDGATALREAHPGLIFGLPLAGLLLGLLYERLGQGVIAGNNLVIDTLHGGGPPIPRRMAPMVLGGTLLTHLFGGSAGREGTAVQMGASLADTLARMLTLGPADRRRALLAGVAGGFGAVFGTPIAGVVFALELRTVGRFEHDGLWPALIAALVGDALCRGLGIVHTPFPRLSAPPLDGPLFLRWLAFAAAVALVTVIFIELTHGLKRWGAARIPRLPLRLGLGGLLIVALWQLLGTTAYLGLGVSGILGAFAGPGALAVPAWKLLFTAITLGAGFIGGEVTPLFFVGAGLGAALADPLGLPAPLAAGVGMAAVFGAAANTPFALSLMAVELFGADVLPHVLLVAVVAYLLTGDRSIYSAQRRLGPKSGALRDGTPGD